MDWIFVALSAYLFLAIANLLDKFLVDKVLKNSKTYAFVACIMGLVVLVIAPWFIEWPGLFWFSFNIFNGFLFAIALWTLYESLKRGEAAKTLVFIGGLTRVFSILLSLVLFNKVYPWNQWLGIGFLLLGVFVIAILPESRNFTKKLFHRFNLKNVHTQYAFRIAAVSAMFYASYFIASKYAYNNQPFVSAFLWNRLGAGIFVLVFLIRKKDRLAIYSLFKKPKQNKNKSLVVFNQILGSSGFILQNYAISLGPVAIINAMQGFQYAFLLILSSAFAFFVPNLYKEKFSWRIIAQKIFAIVIVGIGLAFIAM